MTYDKVLAMRVINKAGKEITKGIELTENVKCREELQKALNTILFLPDVLHIDDEDKKEIDVIDPLRF